MNLIKVSDLFSVNYGVNLELNKMEIVQSGEGVPFVSRTSKNNGVSAWVKENSLLPKNPPNTISVAGGGSVMESFIQRTPYYSGRDLYFLVPLVPLTEEQMLYYCECLRSNKYKFSYGRQANRTLKSLYIPSIPSIPSWVNNSMDEISESWRGILSK